MAPFLERLRAQFLIREAHLKLKITFFVPVLSITRNSIFGCFNWVVRVQDEEGTFCTGPSLREILDPQLHCSLLVSRPITPIPISKSDGYPGPGLGTKPPLRWPQCRLN